MADAGISDYPLVEFLSDLKEGHDRGRRERRYCFVLGSGASVSSGVMTGQDLTTNWIREMFSRANPGKPTDGADAWASDANLGTKGFTFNRRAEFYGDLYSRRFRYDRSRGQEYLRHVLAASKPSFGYSAFAKILATTDHRVVVTTNFDHLTEEALKLYTGIEPQVAGHEALAKFLKNGDGRPHIAKIHGDLFNETYNATDDLRRLKKQWQQPLTNVFRNNIALFIGYAGNDPGFMQFLTELPIGSFPQPPIWTHRAKSGQPKNPRILTFMQKHGGRFVGIPGFDEFMLLLADVFSIGRLDKVMESESAERLRRYRDSLKHALMSLQKQGPLTGSPQLPDWVDEVSNRFLGPAAQRGWWDWHVAATTAGNLAMTDAIYRQGLAAIPNSPVLQAYYASFLANTNPANPDALKRGRNALSRAEQTLGPEHPDTLVTVHELGRVHSYRGEHAEAERLYQRAYETREKLLGPEHPDTFASLNNYATALSDTKNFEKSEALLRKVLEVRSRLLGPEHPDTLGTLNNLAAVLGDKRDYPGAEKLYRETVKTAERALGPEHAETLRMMNNLGHVLTAQDHFGAAQTVLVAALASQERTIGAEHPSTLVTVQNLANLYKKWKKPRQAEPFQRRAFEGRERALGADVLKTLLSKFELADLLKDLKRYDEAAVVCEETFVAMKRLNGLRDTATQGCLELLIFLTKKLGRTAKAAKLRKELVERQAAPKPQ